ncbi:MAG: sigma-70 family RNA polymerase sigma factor [Eubacteriales bacterium]|nr:sigma-70 family RNA polymerase sigma factor [Eubacteriales bacterium]
MPIINLNRQYPHLYDEILLDVSDPIFEVYDLSRKSENNYDRRQRYHHAYFSLDAGDGIENCATQRTPSPEEVWMQKICKEQLREALEHLPVVQSRRVYAYYMLGMKKREIARKEGVSPGCVCSSISTGLKNLKRFYEQHFDDEE